MKNFPAVINYPEAMTRYMMRAAIYGQRMQVLNNSYEKCIEILKNFREINELAVKFGRRAFVEREERRAIGGILLSIRGDKSCVRLCMAINKSIAIGEMPEDWMEE